MGQAKHQGEWEIILFITAEPAFICINRSRLGYKDMPELKIKGNQSLVLSFTHTYEQRYLSAPQWHTGAHLPREACCTGHGPALPSPTGAWGA